VLHTTSFTQFTCLDQVSRPHNSSLKSNSKQVRGGATLGLGGAWALPSPKALPKKKLKKIKILPQILLFFLILTIPKLFFFNLTPQLGGLAPPLKQANNYEISIYIPIGLRFSTIFNKF